MSLADNKALIRSATKKDAPVRDVLNNLPQISEPRCNVCKSEFRSLIDRMIAGPYSYTAIARQFIGKDDNFSGDVRNKRDLDRIRKSVERHAKNHVTMRNQAVREIIEQRAMEHGMLVEEEKIQFLTTEGLLDLYIQKGYEEITDSDGFVRHQDILEALKMKEEMRRDTVNEQLDVMKRQVTAIAQAVNELVPSEIHPLLAERARQLFEEPGSILEIKPLELEKV